VSSSIDLSDAFEVLFEFDVSALGCREVGFYCDTWGKHYSQLILPKIWINHANSAAFRLTAEGKELG
jgi:hypothetical protein